MVTRLPRCIPAVTTRIPMAVQAMTGFVAKQVARGSFHTCALSAAGGIKCWGSNQSGERGDGTMDAKSAAPCVVKW